MRETKVITKDILLKLFIMEKRLTQSPNELYQPKFVCERDNFIHSEYVYMRHLMDLERDDVIIQNYSVNNCTNQKNLDLPCIKLKELNEIIEDDTKILKEWLLEKENNLKQLEETFDKNKLYQSQQYKELKTLINQLKTAIQKYDNFLFTKESIRYGNLNQKCMSIPFTIYFTKFTNQINQILRRYGSKIIYYNPPESGLFGDIASYFYSDDIQGFTSEELTKSKEMLTKIMQQITSIEMKTQVNKTKLATLVQQYAVLKKIRKTVDTRIGLMQKRIDQLNQKRAEANSQIEDLKLEIQRLKNSRENIQREINEIKRQNELSHQDKNRKIRELENIKRDLERENFELKKKVAQTITAKNAIEQENMKMQTRLKEQKQELSSTEKQLNMISKKLNVLDTKVKNNEVKSELLKDTELEEYKNNINELMNDTELQTTSEFIPLSKKSKSKKSKSKKTKSKSKPRLEDILENDDLNDSPPKLKSKTRKPRKPRKSKKSRSEKVDNLLLFDEEVKEEKPKRKRRSKKSNKEISVRVKRKPRKKKENKDEDDDDFIFNFSLRNLM